MSRGALEVGILGFIGLGLTLYVVFGGADFGGGVWDLLARGPTRARQRALIAEAIGPVWEANHVWLIFVLVALLAAFPPAIAVIGEALYLPLALAALGIVFRGAAFSFFTHADPGREQRAWGHVFGIASLITPFFLGAAGAAIATGRITVGGAGVEAELVSSWTSPLSLICGALVVTMCAYAAAAFLTVEAKYRGRADLEEVFRTRALVTAVVAGALAAGGLAALRAGSPAVWSGMLDRGVPALVLSALAGMGSIAALLLRRYQLARIAAALAVATVVWGLGAALWPYLIYPDVTVEGAASPTPTLVAVFWSFVVGSVLLAPSLFWLFRVFKSQRAEERQHS